LNPLGQALSFMLDGLVGYGYKTGRAVVWIAALVAAGTILFSNAYAQGQLTAVDRPPAQPTSTRLHMPWI
jgi:hypothetical protein